ncbi:unnamed protein product [Candida verbasci]|uniref:Vacuolar protein sorting-associated protein 8 central domain-containing protein n=1 Tax=Candida verbasci TaxID=1227364 RepID=A0A9W4XGW9_9ASCO|nr:unnamed protein product [Candida verbasci]
MSLYNDLIPTSIINSPPSINSALSSDAINNQFMKTKFDDRSITKISITLNHYQNLNKSTFIEDEDTTTSTPFNNIFKWSQLNKISNYINSQEFLTLYGEIKLIKSTSIFIAIATTKNQIIIYNYNQIIEFQLQCDDLEISCINFSLDSTTFVAGFTNGSIRLWNLHKDDSIQITPAFTISPISLNSRFVQNLDGHLINCKINFISFIGNSYDKLISSDDSGLIFFHHGITKKFIYHNFVTKNLFSKSIISNIAFLQLGSDYQITDDLGVIALIADGSLSIKSTISLNDSSLTFITTHYTKKLTGLTTLDWFPYIKDYNSRLAFTQDNFLYILEVEVPEKLSIIINNAKNRDKLIEKLKLPVKETCELELEQPIQYIKWLSSNLLVVFFSSKMLTFFYANEQLHLVSCDNFKFNTVEVVKQSLLIFNDNKLFIAKSSNWADILSNKLQHNDYLDALLLANTFYNSTNVAKLSVLRLPLQKQQRAKLIQPILLKIMKESLPHLIKSDQEMYLKLSLNIISEIPGSATNEILEEIYDIIKDDKIFFGAIDKFILENSIKELPTSLLKKLVMYHKDDEELSLLLCTLDLHQLDIDFTIQLCKKYKLTDCLIYIWNYLLNDYKTPLIEFVENLQDDLKVYSYLSYVLNGLQYPTHNSIVNADFARKEICNVLFSTDYCFILLQFNSFYMLSTLNEFFESSYLNDGNDINRQYIIETLLEIFESHKQDFSNYDELQLSIFIARNYSKYQQFIRLPESEIIKIINTILDYQTSEDNELALQSLIPFFNNLEDNQYLIERLKLGKYYNVLINYYKLENKYSQALEIWLIKKTNFKELTELVDLSFNKGNSMDRLKLVGLLKSNFEDCLVLNPTGFYKMINKYAPVLHGSIVAAKEYLQFIYLKEYYKSYDDDIFVTRFIELLIKFDDSALFDFIKKHINIIPEELIYKLNDDKDNIIRAKALMLMHDNKFLEAETILLDKIIDQDLDYLNFIFSIIDESKDNRDKLWLNLIYRLVQSNKSDCIHDCFKKIIDDNLFNSIFNKFLDLNHNETTLSNIKTILQSVFISYSYDTQILKILNYNILNNDIYNKMVLIQNRNLKGWNIMDKNCISCGKPMFSLKDEHYLAWQDYEFSKVLTQSYNKNEELQLIIFKCGHGYHLNCLQRLNLNNQCVICSE